MLSISKIIAAGALAASMLVGASEAATVNFSALPTVAIPNPTATSTTGAVYQNVIGSVAGPEGTETAGSEIVIRVPRWPEMGLSAAIDPPHQPYGYLLHSSSLRTSAQLFC